MARTQARILVRIWGDEDFIALAPRPQRMYLFLLSQPNLNHAGLLPLTIRRWALSAGGLTTDDIKEDLDVLARADKIVVDEVTEEVFVRTLVRNDGVWKQPKVMLAMQADANEIVSPLIRYTLRDELLKIDLSALEKQETREAIQTVITQTVETLPDTPPQGYPIPQATPTEYPHAGAGARSSASTSASTTSHLPIAPTKSTREPDEIWDALLQACNIDTTNIPKSARGAYNAAVKQLRDIGATPEEIRRRASIYRGQWRDVSLTPTALVRRWGECERPVLSTHRSPLDRQLDAAMERAQEAESQMTERKALP